ncbi:MAG TPA: hypothetical protein VGN72_04275 [Tepidisphaeraceae bacterium]|jgi:hypothetical protein|nr:hypothetical protein [Tepidisphaeraceae bacterium]
MWLAFFILILIAGVVLAALLNGRGRAYALLAIAGMLLVLPIGCAASEPFTTANLNKHALRVGDAAGQFAVTGNPLPVLFQTLSMASFVVGGIGAAVARKKAKQLKERQRPWTDAERQAHRAAQSAAHGLPLSIAPTPRGSEPTLPAARAA